MGEHICISDDQDFDDGDGEIARLVNVYSESMLISSFLFWTSNINLSIYLPYFVLV